MALAGGDVTDGLGHVALAGAAGSGVEDGDLFLDEAAGGQVVDETAVEVGQPAEVEAFQGLLATEVGASQALGEFFLIAPGDFVVNQQTEEVGVGQLAIHGFPVASLQGIDDAGQA